MCLWKPSRDHQERSELRYLTAKVSQCALKLARWLMFCSAFHSLTKFYFTMKAKIVRHWLKSLHSNKQFALWTWPFILLLLVWVIIALRLVAPLSIFGFQYIFLCNGPLLVFLLVRWPYRTHLIIFIYFHSTFAPEREGGPFFHANIAQPVRSIAGIWSHLEIYRHILPHMRMPHPHHFVCPYQVWKP